MLRGERIADVERRLLRGQPSRQICAETGVSRGVISKVFNGKARPENRRQTAGGEWPGHDPDAPEEKCDECGVRVKQPCLACWLRKQGNW